MAEVLKQALRSLCTKTGWCYAVFWKLKRRSRMVLTWEEGHYNALQSGLARSPLEHGLCRQTEDQIHLAVVKMSFHVHSLGEGIIGRVAFTAKHQWVYGSHGDKQPGEASGQTSSDKYPDGWSNQFAAGIKTIAVVAVPQGVVQLGSMQLMPEDLNLVGQIRALFGTLQSVPGAVVSDLTYESQARRNAAISRAPTTLTTPQATPPAACFAVGSTMLTKGIGSAQNRAASTGISAESGHGNYRLADQKATLGFQHDGAQRARAASLWPSGYLKHPSEVSQQFQPLATYDSRIGHTRGQGEGDPLLDLLRPNSGKPAAADSIQFGPAWSPSSFGVGGFEGLHSSGADTATTGLLDPDEGFDYNSLFKALQKDDLDDFNWLLATLPDQVPVSSGSNFVLGDELSEALVPQQKNGPGNGYNSSLLTPPSEDVKAAEKQLQFEPRPSAGYCDILLGLTQKKPEPLLDAVVAGVSVTPDPMKSVREMPSAAGGSLLPVQAATVTSPSATCKDSHLPDNTPAAAAAAAAAASAVKWSPTLQVKPAASSWAAEACQMKKSEDHTSRDTSSSSRKQEDATRTTGRKRLRPGETPRPRPKDRQQIQDRVRELRDIVPNATKCSIDSLLEKTIKHMQFLQSVTQHGDKWKAGGDLKIGGMLERHSMDTGGASWAMEVGSKGPCPIVVENLSQPGQMLVEMRCEEKGLFWEIADNIRNLGLIILKGVMESRSDKVWARFNVEMQASREVDRVQVLWNLLQLLKPNNNSKQHNVGTSAASSFTGSEITDICSDSLTHHGGIMVSSANW